MRGSTNAPFSPPTLLLPWHKPPHDSISDAWRAAGAQALVPMHVGASYTKTAALGRMTDTFDKVKPLYEGEPYVLDFAARTCASFLTLHARLKRTAAPHVVCCGQIAISSSRELEPQQCAINFPL